MKERQRKYRHIFRMGGFGGGQTVNIAVPCVDAKSTVRITRTEANVIHGKAGIAVACANAECAMESPKAFPHKVYMAEFTKSKAYIVDRLDRNGQPARCIRYRHDDEQWIGKFDKPGGKRKLILSGDVERVVTLSPPAQRNKPSVAGRPKGKSDGSRTSKMGYGATKRAIEAGWIVAPPEAA